MDELLVFDIDIDKISGDLRKEFRQEFIAFDMQLNAFYSSEGMERAEVEKKLVGADFMAEWSRWRWGMFVRLVFACRC